MFCKGYQHRPHPHVEPWLLLFSGACHIQPLHSVLHQEPCQQDVWRLQTGMEMQSRFRHLLRALQSPE